MRFLLLFAVAFTLFAGSPAEQTPNVPLPSAFRQISPGAGAAAPAGPIEKWWKVFDDPVLDSLIERASKNNHDVLIAASRVAEVRAAGGIARAALLPEVGQNTSANRIRGGFSQGVIRVGGGSQPGQGSNLVSPFETSVIQSGLDMRWEIDLFGGLRKNLKAAKADAAASEEMRRDVQLLVTSEIARSYMELRGVQQQLLIAEKNRDAQRDMLHLTRVRADAGLATELGVERQAAQLASTEAAIPVLQHAAAQTLHRISVLSGDQPGSEMVELTRPQPLPPIPPDVAAGIPSELLKRRPDIRRAEVEITAAMARVGAARSDLFPKLVFTGLSGRQATGVSGLTLGAGNFFAFGPGIQLPLFTGGRIRSNIGVQEARLQQALHRYEQEVLAAFEETENALAAYRYEQDRRASLAAAAASSRTAVDLAREVYAAGLGDFLSVLEAQRSQFAAEEELQRSETALRSKLIALYKALGGGIDLQ